MGMDDKIGNKAEELKGQAKETAGKVTDDPELEAEGVADQAPATSSRRVRRSRTR